MLFAVKLPVAGDHSGVIDRKMYEMLLRGWRSIPPSEPHSSTAEAALLLTRGASLFGGG